MTAYAVHIRLSLLLTLLLIVASGVFGQIPPRVITTVHFKVEYERRVKEEDARAVADYMERDYKYLSDHLGLDLRNQVVVRIHDTPGKYLSQTRQRKDWRKAIYVGSVLHLQPVTILVQQRVFEQTLSYELANIFLQQTAGKGCPRWLRESFAVYHAGLTSTLSPPVGTRMKSFSDLAQDLQEYREPPRRNDVLYLLGHTMIHFVETYGEQTALSMFGSFDGMTPLEDVLKNTFGQEFPHIERTWANSIAAVVEPFKR